MKTKVYLIENHPIVRSALRLYLNSQPDMVVVGESDTVAQWHQPNTLPDILILDMDSRIGSGLSELDHLLAATPSLKIIAYSLQNTPDFARATLQHGAKGFVTKLSHKSELLGTIRAVCRNAPDTS